MSCLNPCGRCGKPSYGVFCQPCRAAQMREDSTFVRRLPYRVDRDSLWLNRARAGYCGLCEARVLYVTLGASTGIKPGLNSGTGELPAGEILDAERSAKGRWDVCPDGFRYAQMRAGGGHRVHRCRVKREV